jgi:hypothetical protein
MSPTLKAEQETAASAITLATQTPPTSYTLTSQTSSGSYQYLDLGYRQNDMVLHQTASPFHLFTLILDRSGVQLVIIHSPLPTNDRKYGNKLTTAPVLGVTGITLVTSTNAVAMLDRGIGDARWDLM